MKFKITERQYKNLILSLMEQEYTDSATANPTDPTAAETGNIQGDEDQSTITSNNDGFTGGGDGTSTGTDASSASAAANANVQKWESGVSRGVANNIDPNAKWEDEIAISRGAANQLGNSKWEDIVGSKISRGKANPLN